MQMENGENSLDIIFLSLIVCTVNIQSFILLVCHNHNNFRDGFNKS